MKYVLARSNRRVLIRFARSRVLLAFDFDGTLAPIVAEANRAAMRATTRALLKKVALRYPTVVISGRARDEVSSRLRGVPVAEVIGNHGIEPWQVSQRGLLAVRRWRLALARSLFSLPGVTIEDKTYSLAVHYRHSPDAQRARDEIQRAASELGKVRVITGKYVVNLLPARAPHKGIALEKARKLLGCDTAVFVGDDETDEDIFALDRPTRLLTIRVGRSAASLASYFLRSQAEIDQLLRVLIDFRLRLPSPRRTPGSSQPHSGFRLSPE